MHGIIWRRYPLRVLFLLFCAAFQCPVFFPIADALPAWACAPVAGLTSTQWRHPAYAAALGGAVGLSRGIDSGISSNQPCYGNWGTQVACGNVSNAHESFRLRLRAPFPDGPPGLFFFWHCLQLCAADSRLMRRWPCWPRVRPSRRTLARSRAAYAGRRA